MMFLLDVNVLVALGHAAHPSHEKAETWLASITADSQLATCSITEIGFIRVSLNARLADSVDEAKALLEAIRASGRIKRLSDDLGADSLPAYVKKAKDTTDGHLLALARHHAAKLVTFDTDIPSAHLIA